MLDVVVSMLHLVIFVSAIGSFIVLKSLFNTFTKTQKIWVAILVVSVVISFIISFFTNEMPDIIQGYKDGFNAGK
ncbi:hypothetical protein BMS84_10825 [Leuconostoc pseudomesenteroides]|nr:hypothetical protein BMS84_10825 [Leuconostoc pseudomesenteroides]